jgi:hypothetical protein
LAPPVRGGSNELRRVLFTQQTNGACPRPNNSNRTSRSRRSVRFLQRLPDVDHREKREDESLQETNE